MDEEIPLYGKPAGQEGEDLLDKMDKGHTPIALWSYTNIEIKDDDITLDIGCGSGLNVKRQYENHQMQKVMVLIIVQQLLKKQQNSIVNL